MGTPRPEDHEKDSPSAERSDLAKALDTTEAAMRLGIAGPDCKYIVSDAHVVVGQRRDDQAHERAKALGVEVQVLRFARTPRLRPTVSVRRPPVERVAPRSREQGRGRSRVTRAGPSDDDPSDPEPAQTDVDVVFLDALAQLDAARVRGSRGVVRPEGVLPVRDRVAAMTAAEFVQGLAGVRRNGSGYMARCPAHDDRTPSLSVKDGDQVDVVVWCHAGCTKEAVCAAHPRGPVDPRDLSPRSVEPSARRREAARYRYVDGGGCHLYDVIRWDPKGFSQVPANGKRGAGAMDGVPRVLYNLPAVDETVKAGGAVWVCEGEKDCDRLNPVLAEVGAVATTNPGGAGKWRSEYNATLRGANVVIVSHRDDPGREHAQDVAGYLGGVVATVCIVEPATGRTPTTTSPRSAAWASSARSPRPRPDLVPR